MFELGGRNPGAYEVIKLISTFGVVTVIAILWYQLGVVIGVINGFQSDKQLSVNIEGNDKDSLKELSDRIDIESLTGEFDIVDDGTLLSQLENSINKKSSSLKGTKDFLCCFVSRTQRSERYDVILDRDNYFPHDKKFRCHGISRLKSNGSEPHKILYSRKIARLKSVTQAMKCGSGNLAYQLTIAD